MEWSLEAGFGRLGVGVRAASSNCVSGWFKSAQPQLLLLAINYCLDFRRAWKRALKPLDDARFPDQALDIHFLDRTEVGIIRKLDNHLPPSQVLFVFAVTRRDAGATLKQDEFRCAAVRLVRRRRRKGFNDR